MAARIYIEDESGGRTEVALVKKGKYVDVNDKDIFLTNAEFKERKWLKDLGIDLVGDDGRRVSLVLNCGAVNPETINYESAVCLENGKYRIERSGRMEFTGANSFRVCIESLI